MATVIAVGMLSGLRQAGQMPEATPELTSRLAQLNELLTDILHGRVTPEAATERLLTHYPGVVIGGAIASVALPTGLATIIVLLVLTIRGHRLKPRADWAPGAPWNLFDVLEVVLLFLFAQIVLVLFARALRGGVQPARGEVMLTTAAVYVASAALTLALVFARTPGGWHYLRQVVRPVRGSVSRLVGIGFLSFSVGLVAMYIVTAVTGSGQNALRSPVVPELVEAGGVWVKVVAVLLVALIGPPFEETIFRGMVYRSLRARWGIPIGVVLSALVFALAHMTPQLIIPILALGVVFASVYEITGALLPSAVAHCLQNGMTVAFILGLAS
jgi:hypothetical protein